jgi:4-hydroxy-3-polyprenylbenzoate decarboxylase
MKFKDLRDFISFLDTKGQISRIHTPVSWDLEITEITDRVIKNGGPALLFENVEGYDMPLLINLYGTQQRTAWALGVEHLDSLGDRIKNLLNTAQAPPQGLLNKMKSLADVMKLGSYIPRSVGRAPCQEVVFQGDDVDLLKLPILKCWPMDGGRFITLPLVISRDPQTGARNVGTYRMQIYDQRTTGMHWQTHKVGAHHARVAKDIGQQRLEVAVALGGDPASMWTGSAPLPPGVDEFLMAGFIRGEAVEVVKAKTVDLEVPAQAEIVLEGYVDPYEVRPEGPFGDHTGYYSLEEDYSVFHVTAVTHRRQPIYPTIIVGRPVQEDYFMGKATERLFLPILQTLLPEVVDINMPAEGIFHSLVIVSIKKEYPGHANKVMHAFWGLGLLMLAKTILVVDHFVNVHDLSEVAWRVTNNISPEDDVIFTKGPLDDLDYASPTPRFGSKMGIDATEKGAMDGRIKPWPPEIVMTPDIKALVDKKWQQYGIDL